MSAAARSLVVLGGTGFFGKSILDSFRRGLLAPWGIGRVVAVARHPETLAAHPELLVPGVELVALDVATATDLPRGDYVIHAANTTDARRYAADPAAERAAILAAADNFVRCAAAHPGARIVYASSGAVYGQQPADVAALDEDAPLAAASGLVAYKRDYAEAKRLAEARVAALGAGGMDVAVARCFAFVGPYLPRDQHFAIGNFIADGIADRPVVVKAAHPVIRSYLHADDLVRWLLTIADAASPASPVYNIGSDEAVDMIDLAYRIATRYEVVVDHAAQSDTPVDRYVPSIARAARELGLTVHLDLDGALDAMVARFASHRLVPARQYANPRSITGVADH